MVKQRSGDESGLKLPKGLENHGGKIRINVWHKGKRRHRETLDASPFNARDVAAAEKRRAEIEARIRSGLSAYPGGQGVSTLTLFADACKDYMRALEARNAKESHVTETALMLDRYWIPAFAHTPVSEITDELILDELAKMKVKVKTKLNRVGPLGAVLDLKKVTPNPVRTLGLIKDQRPPIERYLPAERSALLKALSGQALVYFAILFGGGLRPGEALGLQWTDYNGKRLRVAKQITKRRHVASTKTRYERDVILPTWTRDILNAHTTRFAGGFIFQTGDGTNHQDTDAFNNAWRKAHEKARVPYRIPYTCRHTRAAELLSQGVSPPDGARYLGHSVEMFYRTYSEWIEGYAKDKLSDSRFEGAGITLPKSVEEDADWGELGRVSPQERPKEEGLEAGALILKGKIGDPDGTRTR